MEQERTYNFLEEYEVDKWADKHMQDPIVFNWGNVCEVEPIEKDPAFFDTPLYEMAKKRGMVVERWLVRCPIHGERKQAIVFDNPPNRIADKCDKCITAELNRVENLRCLRMIAWKKEMANDNRH